MTDPIKTSEINQLSMKNGLFIGLISVVLSFVIWVVDPLMMFTNTSVGLIIGIVVPIILLVMMGIDVRKKIGGYWTFGEAFKSLMIMCFFSLILTTLYSFILFKFIDPALPAKANAAILDSLSAKLSKMGLEQSKIDEVSKPFLNGENEAKMQPTLVNMARNFAIGLISYAIMALIIAAIIKKQPPVAIMFDDELDTPTTT